MRRAAGGLTLLTVMLALAAPALGANHRPAAKPASTPATAAVPAATPPKAGRWQLVEGTEGIWGGIALRLIDPAAETPGKTVALLACQRPPAFYIGSDTLSPKTGAIAIDLAVGGKVFAVPMASPAPGGAVVEAAGPVQAGLLDAIQATKTVQILYGDQASAVFAAPDARVLQGFLATCRQVEGEHGQGG